MDVSVQQAGLGRALPPTDAAFASGEATLVAVETEQRPTVLGLVAAGRMVPSTGRVLLDGREDRRGLRRRVALVDAPRASDPEPAVAVAGVLAEELLYAGLPGDPRSVRAWARDLGVDGLLDVPIGDVAPSTRTRALAELAILRDDVEAVVLVAPDRHGGDPLGWWGLAQDLAVRGFAVLAIASPASARALQAIAAPGVDPARVRTARSETASTARPSVATAPPAAPPRVATAPTASASRVEESA